MLISHKWLENYLPDLAQFDSKTISESLTTSLAEVEGVTQFGNGLSKIVSGEVLTVKEHQSNKKLKICTVNTGKDERTIVCGAPNVAQGQRVVVCLPGGSVYDPSSEFGSATTVQVEERTIGEVTSQGMICSAKEAGLSDEHTGILVLEPEIELGIDIAELLRDKVYEIENKSISHRPDAFSHLGIARELAAILKMDLVQPAYDNSIIPTAKLELDVTKKVDDELCARFNAVVLKDIVVKPAPLWLQAKLGAVGIRSVNNVVDITNYVMMDIGQPLHAFDYDKIDSHKLTVRKSKQGEKIKALDGKEYKLRKDSIVISDGSKAESIAGIMGGARTEITKRTKNVVIEGANWNMFSIRRTSRDLGLRSEASTRFEKGQDPNQTEPAVKQAVELVQDVAGGEVASEMIDIYNDPRAAHQVGLQLPFVKRFLGIELAESEVIEILERLGLKLIEQETANTNEIQKETRLFEAPTYRPDLTIQQDLLEEIARLHGYDKISPTLPASDLRPAVSNPSSVLSRSINAVLLGAGMDELITYSFVGKKLYEDSQMEIKNCLKIDNPISPELSYMRNSLVPSLLGKMVQNANNFDRFGYFEINKIVERELDGDGIHLQPGRVSGLIFVKEAEQLYSELKGIVEALEHKLNLTLTYKPTSKKDTIVTPVLHPARSALLNLDDQTIGVLGEVHPKVMLNFDLEGRAAIFEMDFDALLSSYQKVTRYVPLSEFPEVKRDLSFWLPKDTTYEQLTAAIWEKTIKTLTKVEFNDRFDPEDKKERISITITLILQSSSKTLEDKQIKEVVGEVTKRVEAGLNGKLRK
ncbi:MAG: phenylalanine--tRNA ligase subunit beta [Candidatus Dojkabacteria bacterium]